MKQNKDNYKIYAHINKINGKIYVGQTCAEAEKRWRNGNGYKNSPRFYEAIQKYGWNNFEHIIIQEGLCEDLANMFERELIKKYNTTNINYGYNIFNGKTTNDSNNIKNVFLQELNNENMNCLKKIIDKKKMSYRDLQNITNIGKSTLHRIANYEQSPTQDIMISIARGLKMKVTEIFYFDY